MHKKEEEGRGRTSAGKQLKSPQMNHRCVPDSGLVVNDRAVDSINPDILDITPLSSEV